MKKAAALATSLLLVGLGASACGGGASGAPKDASVEDFCSTMQGFGDDSAEESKVADHVDELKDTGTPSDMPEDARKGFEFIIENAEKLDETGKTLADQAAFEDAFSPDAYTQLMALFTYYGSTCLNLPTDLPTE